MGGVASSGRDGVHGEPRRPRLAGWRAGPCVFLLAVMLGACTPAPLRTGAHQAPADAARDSGYVMAGPQAIELFPEVAGFGGGWEPWILHPSKRRTSYRWSRDQEGVIVTAVAEGAASGLARALDVDPRRFPLLEWRWQVDALIPGADNTDPHGEDAPVRIVLAFEGNRGALPLRDRMFFEQVRLLSGRDMPYATLMYIWENQQPQGSVLRNPHTARVRKVVASSGSAEVGQWVRLRRNFVEDYRRAFGTEPGRLVGIAMLTDSDNTGEKTRGRYGSLRLVAREWTDTAR